MHYRPRISTISEEFTMKYDVQQIARNYMRNLPDGTETFKVHPMYLQGLLEEEFKDGYNALIQLKRDIYTGVITNPKDFGMPLIPIGSFHDYPKSHSKFLRVPRLLYAIGLVGVLGADMTLYVNGQEFLEAAKQLLITGTLDLLHQFTDYGFEIAGLSDKINSNDELIFSYPDCRALTVVLSSMAKACAPDTSRGAMYTNKGYFHVMSPHLFEFETPKNINCGIEYLYRCLNDQNRETAKALHDLITSKGHKLKTQLGGLMRNNWTFTYTGKKSKRVLMFLQTRQDNLIIKLNLENIDEYKNEIMQIPEHIREHIRNNGHKCDRTDRCLPKCMGGIVYSLDDVEYFTCRVSAFLFYNISAADLPYIKKLIELEMKREE